jgi:predicted transcriptional regulator of viral defense system
MPQSTVPRLVSAPFFSAHPVFTRAEYAAAVGRRTGDKVVTTMLGQHLRAGNIRRVARGVFASVPKHADARTWVVDRFLAASRLRPGAVVAYHAALDLHGCAYTEGHEVQLIARGEPGLFDASGLACRFIRPPRGFAPPDGVIKLDRLGLHVAVTSIERTIVDLFDRYDLAGGAEELLNSLDLVARVDTTALVRYARALGNATAAGALGSWLERNQKRLGVADRVLDQFHKLAPAQPRYALGTKSGEGKAAKGWNVILPRDVAERHYEGL